jgi:hypothetical protein
MAIPAFLTAPPPIALKQFGTIYQLGRVSSPPSCLFTAATFFYLSYCTHPSNSHHFIESQSVWKSYLLAGACAGAVVPYTYAALEKVNHKLLHLGKMSAEALKNEDEIDTKILLRRWRSLNLVRSGMLAASAIIGFCTLLS